MNPRLLIVAAVLVAGGIAAVTLTRDDSPTVQPTASPTIAGPRCLKLPAASARSQLPSWIPEDLPMPRGFLVQKLPDVQGLKRSILMLRTNLDDFVTSVLNDWPGEGWVLGKGDREPGEAEDTFYRGKVFGQFRALDIYCGHSYLQVLLVMGKIPRQPLINPSPSGSPLVPGASPSAS